ncbi:Multi antimicrobial extrusion protein [Artemisia annua]|uniref:Protein DETOXIFICATION n=1 Tax=Artemisia annua TaxID=35608 RepID=A0A2U1LFR5_ARTAN|nr:Multi antimicrobial extrusion protein [Artemisia annua]
MSSPNTPSSTTFTMKTTKTHESHQILTLSNMFHETKALFKLASPIALTALIFYTRSIVSMLFLGHTGDIELAAGSLAIAFANITGYSVLAGLALGMEPLCSQAFGANQGRLISLTLHRTVIFLLVVSIPITFLWINSSHILNYFHQDPNITHLARTFLLFSLPELVSNSLIHPTRIYLRTQGITYPLAFASLVGTVVQLPLNYVLVSHFGLGVVGVASASSVSNFIVLVVLVVYVWWAGLHLPTWTSPTRECLTGWGPLIRLATPSCVSVCLEWWFYEIMIVICGLLVDPKATVASMGVLIQTTAFLYVFPSSLGFAVSTRVGNELGASRPDKARITAVVSIFLSGLMGLSALIFTTSVKNIWARMFTNDSDILRLTSIALPIIGLCELGNCLQTIGWNINWEQEAKKAHMLTCNEFTIGETTSDSSDCNHDNEQPIRIVVTLRICLKHYDKIIVKEHVTLAGAVLATAKRFSSTWVILPALTRIFLDRISKDVTEFCLRTQIASVRGVSGEIFPSRRELHMQETSTELMSKNVWRLSKIGSVMPSCTFNECRGCKYKCIAEQVPVEGNDPINSAYHYRCVCHM